MEYGVQKESSVRARVLSGFIADRSTASPTTSYSEIKLTSPSRDIGSLLNVEQAYFYNRDFDPGLVGCRSWQKMRR